MILTEAPNSTVPATVSDGLRLRPFEPGDLPAGYALSSA